MKLWCLQSELVSPGRQGLSDITLFANAKNEAMRWCACKDLAAFRKAELDTMIWNACGQSPPSCSLESMPLSILLLWYMCQVRRQTGISG